jgi:hypothetical protein
MSDNENQEAILEEEYRAMMFETGSEIWCDPWETKARHMARNQETVSGRVTVSVFVSLLPWCDVLERARAVKKLFKSQKARVSVVNGSPVSRTVIKTDEV